MIVQEKVPHGKMVTIEVEAEGGITKFVKITGDFFCHPEDAIDNIEKKLTGIPVSTEEGKLVEKISNALGEAQLIGASPEDLARLFRKALS